MFDLTDRVAVVTGVLGKLGPVWAQALLEAGARVAGLDLAEAPESGALSSLSDAYDADRLRLYTGDVLDRDSLAEARAAIERELGPASILVNNAGIDQPPDQVESCHLHEIPADAVRRVLDVNVVGLFQVAQVFGEAMVERGGGSIINIGSLYASVSPDARLYDHVPVDPPFLKPPAYGASKAAVVNLTRYLATHWGPRGVRVNALSPGGVLGGQDEEFQRKFNARVPLGRMAEASDLGGPLVFLASEASSYVNGIELRVDGGFTAW
ncbi:MAG TPA: SDR family oxidoreductase [Acidobacteriota bacterium]|nr:SDR family oxidoreductase [Acidobacteriota bacterium]